MQLIEQYIFRRVAVMTLSTLVVLTGIVLTTQILARVDMLTQSQEAMLTFLKIGGLLIPSMAMIVIPFALLVGAMRTLNAMNSDSELAVLESAGRSPAATARPMLFLALLLTLASLLLALVVEPWANRTLREVVTQATADLVRSAAQAGTFRQIRRGSYIQITDQFPGGDFGRIVIVDTRDPKSQLIYHAKRGSLLTHEATTLFLLLDGEVHSKNTVDGNVSIISFTSTTFDFSEFVSTRGTTYQPQELATAYLLAPAPDDRLALDAPQELRREINRRFSEWLYPLVFGLIAVHFAGGARTNRQQQPLRMAAGGALALALRVVGFVAVSNSGGSAFFTLLAYLAPLSAIAILGALLFVNGGGPAFSLTPFRFNRPATATASGNGAGGHSP